MIMSLKKGNQSSSWIYNYLYGGDCTLNLNYGLPFFDGNTIAITHDNSFYTFI
jgi:hypothetical protein